MWAEMLGQTPTPGDEAVSQFTQAMAPLLDMAQALAPIAITAGLTLVAVRVVVGAISKGRVPQPAAAGMSRAVEWRSKEVAAGWSDTTAKIADRSSNVGLDFDERGRAALVCNSCGYKRYNPSRSCPKCGDRA